MESDTWDCESIGCNQLILGGVCTCMELQESPISSGRYMGLTPSAESLLCICVFCSVRLQLCFREQTLQVSQQVQIRCLCATTISGAGQEGFPSLECEVAQGIFSTLHCQMEDQSQPAMAMANLQPK